MALPALLLVFGGALGLEGCGSEVVVQLPSAGAIGTVVGSEGGGGSIPTTTGSATTSSSASSSSTSSSTTVPTDGCDDAEPWASCDACYEGDCAVDYCAEIVQACFDEPDCIDLEDCTGNCGMDSVCWTMCKQDYPGGIEPLSAVYDCFYCQACPVTCDTTDGCPFQI